MRPLPSPKGWIATNQRWAIAIYIRNFAEIVASNLRTHQNPGAATVNVVYTSPV
jgi:hypothetical protein